MFTWASVVLQSVFNVYYYNVLKKIILMFSAFACCAVVGFLEKYAVLLYTCY